MTTLFKKLNYKNQTKIIILNSPSSFKNEINEMKDFAKIEKQLNNDIEFVMCFTLTLKEVENFAFQIKGKLKNDAVVWVCYPKQSSKNYNCDFNRDNGFESLKKINLETVRQVSIDEDFSALRFRKLEFIKIITRK